MDNKEIYIDNLTKLYNMRYLKENYSNYIENNKDVKVIAIDFTKFKYINDNYGHHEGDICLSSFGIFLKKYFKGDICVRRSGDEFLILTKKENKKIEISLKKVIKTIEKNYNERTIPVNYKFNSGITVANHSILKTLDKADITMYEAKKEELLYSYYSSIAYKQAKEKNDLIKEIKKEIKEDQIKYSIQKLYNMKNGEVNIADIYSRNINHDNFLNGGNKKILQESYVIKQLDLHNLKKIILSEKINDNIKYIINLHSETISSKEEDFDKTIKNIVKTSKNDPHNFIICINIDTVGDEWPNIVKKIELLKKLGFAIALGSYNFSSNNPAINIWMNTNIEYMKINKESWKINSSKKEDILKDVIKTIVKYNTIPIFTKVENEKELIFLNTLCKKALIKGNYLSKEMIIDI